MFLGTHLRQQCQWNISMDTSLILTKYNKQNAAMDLGKYFYNGQCYSFYNSNGLVKELFLLVCLRRVVFITEDLTDRFNNIID